MARQQTVRLTVSFHRGLYRRRRCIRYLQHRQKPSGQRNRFPNGLMLSRDEKTLYVNNTQGDYTMRST